MQAPMCRDCFTGTLRGDVTPTGAEETIHGLPTYVAHPEPGVEPLGTVVILTDAFGWKLRNTRALADAYARRVPCTVYVPDFMNGHAIPESVLSLLDKEAAATTPSASLFARTLARAKKLLSTLSLLPTLLRFLLHNRQAVAHPRVLSFMTALRTSSPPQAKVGVAGFCWGGLHAVLLTHDVPRNKVAVSTLPAAGAGAGAGGSGTDGGTDGGGWGGAAAGEGPAVVGAKKDRPLIDCAFTAHPSLLSFPAHIEAAVQPLSVANGDADQYMGAEKMRRLVRILEAKNAERGAASEGRHEAVVYPGAKHGFAVRGDPGDPMQRERGEQSEEQAVRWFRHWFGGP